jgi:4-hydroxy-3-polyprenylbenzoate decarboxylase
MYFVPAAILDAFRHEGREGRQAASPSPSTSGLDPAVYIASCFEAPSTPLGFNELSIAGSLRGKAVEMVRCVSVDAKAVANAEIVIEGELLPNVRVAEDQFSKTGKAMPEFPGYNGPAKPELPVIKVKAVTHRVRPIMQTCIGPSEEHVNLAGIPTEASIITMVNRALPGLLQNVYAHPCGGGKYVAVLQVKKSAPPDEGRQRQAALLAFSAFSELKHVILVDEDVDPFDSNDVMWAMTTRFQADVDVICIPGVRCHPLDPSQSPEMSPSIRAGGIACKAIFDCTVPLDQKARFKRAQFKEVDFTRFLNG